MVKNTNTQLSSVTTE